MRRNCMETLRFLGIRAISINGNGTRMTTIGTVIDETGMLLRDGGAFYLRRDIGGRYQLELHRVPVDLVEKRVRVRGTLVGADLVNADGVAPE
jgi:hypothetical protein